ncbi:hypothetical protein V565_338180, partial [Rhizoctonia solani 123E]
MSGTLDSNTDIGTGQGRSVVGIVTRHGAEVVETLETLDDFVLVLGEHTGKAIGIHDYLVESCVLAAESGAVLESLGRVHVITETEATTGLLCDSELITGNPLDLDTEGNSIVDDLLVIVTGRIEDGEETNKLETAAVGLDEVLVDGELVGGERGNRSPRKATGPRVVTLHVLPKSSIPAAISGQGSCAMAKGESGKRGIHRRPSAQSPGLVFIDVLHTTDGLPRYATPLLDYPVAYYPDRPRARPGIGDDIGGSY